MTRRDTGRLANEAFTLNPIISSKQRRIKNYKLNCLSLDSAPLKPGIFSLV